MPGFGQKSISHNALQRKAYWAVWRARFLLNVKVSFGSWLRSSEEKERGRAKLEDLKNVLEGIQTLSPKSAILDSPKALLEWQPLKDNQNTLAQLLNRHRLRQTSNQTTTTLNIVLRALGEKPPRDIRFPALRTKPLTQDGPNGPVIQSPIQIAEPFPIQELPTNPLQHVLSFLSDKDVSSYAIANKRAHAQTQAELSPTSVRRFLHDVAYAKEPDLIEAKILENPNLLLAYGTTQDQKGRVIRNKTALQIAASGLDPENAQRIWDLFVDERVIAKLNISRDELEAHRNRQYQEQFPEPPSVDTTTFDFTPFVLALTNASIDELNRMLGSKGDISVLGANHPLARALNDFWEQFPEDYVPKTGLRFPYGDYLNAEKIYDANYQTWGNQWDSPRNMAFARFILGGFHRRADARLAQILSFSLFEASRGAKVPRHFKLQYGRNSFTDYCSGLFTGFGFVYLAAGEVGFGGWFGRRARGYTALRIFFNKHSEACRLTRSPPTHTPPQLTP